jgi:hypothetical protein
MDSIPVRLGTYIRPLGRDLLHQRSQEQKGMC